MAEGTRWKGRKFPRIFALARMLLAEDDAGPGKSLNFRLRQIQD